MIYSENILICILIPLLITLFFVRGGSRRFVIAFSIGMVVCLLAAYISGFIQLTSSMGQENTSIFISPIVEEIMKLLPMAFYLTIFKPDNRALLAAGAGLGAGFATFENCCYILTAGASRLSYVIIRGLAVGVMHIVCMVIVILGIVLARKLRALTFPGILGALSLSINFHGLYNLLVSKSGPSSFVGYVLPIVTAFLIYIPYRRYREKL